MTQQDEPSTSPPEGTSPLEPATDSNGAAAEVQSPEEPTPPPPPPPRPERVDALDRLESENLHLRALNIVQQKQSVLQQIQLLQQQAQQIDTQLAEAHRLIEEKKKEMSEKYGVDFSQMDIEQGTGRIVPRVSQQHIAALRAQQMQAQRSARGLPGGIGG